MKRIVLLICFVAAMSLCAGAQTYYIDFHGMPIATSPAPMPDFYPEQSGMYWDNFYYVTPGVWKDAGAGFWVDPSTKHNTVAFIGGPLCNLAIACHGSIKLVPMMMAPFNKTFTPVSITLTAGWLPNKVTVTAFNNGTFVGRLVWNLTIEPQTFEFPPTWKNVTQLSFIPDVIPSNTTNPKAGSMVIYSFVIMEH
jgi:hypothetical protein